MLVLLSGQLAWKVSPCLRIESNIPIKFAATIWSSGQPLNNENYDLTHRQWSVIPFEDGHTKMNKVHMARVLSLFGVEARLQRSEEVASAVNKELSKN
jgi:hypothetical protein